MANLNGRIIQILGGVVDVEFQPNISPRSLMRSRSARGTISSWLEVQNHLGNNLVRCLAMDTTDGLKRGLPAIATEDRSWSRLVSHFRAGFNVLGRPVDGLGFREV